VWHIPLLQRLWEVGKQRKRGGKKKGGRDYSSVKLFFGRGGRPTFRTVSKRKNQKSEGNPNRKKPVAGRRSSREKKIQKHPKKEGKDRSGAFLSSWKNKMKSGGKGKDKLISQTAAGRCPGKERS